MTAAAVMIGLQDSEAERRKLTIRCEPRCHYVERNVQAITGDRVGNVMTITMTVAAKTANHPIGLL